MNGQITLGVLIDEAHDHSGIERHIELQSMFVTRWCLAPQVTLGISTLVMYVPVSLGAAHQAGALTLFTVVLGLLHSLRRPYTHTPALARVRIGASRAQDWLLTYLLQSSCSPLRS
jgi:Cytochrome oxidase assembly protein